MKTILIKLCIVNMHNTLMLQLNRKVAEIQKAMRDAETKKNNKFEYDSDEDTEGGTWEHKARTKEMEKTREKARELTEMNKGKHHIGDFLPPEELDKFVETVSAVKEDRTPGMYTSGLINLK